MPLVVQERTSERVRGLYKRHPVMVTWWATRVEVRSGLARRIREEIRFDTAAADATVRKLSAVWNEVLASEDVRSEAERLLRTFPLRAAGALQLAAAMDASGGDPSTLPFVTLDRQLASAAARLGFRLSLNDLTQS